jgi:hypothetical protein
MIDGLKLTFTGDELRRLLHERAEAHRGAVARIKLEQCSGREPTIDCPQLPDHIVEEMIDRHEWRSEVLDFIRAHVESAETYRLGSYDLEFAELLPEAPGGIDEDDEDDEEDEYDPRSRLAFQVRRLATALTGLQYGVFKMCLVDAESEADAPDAP